MNNMFKRISLILFALLPAFWGGAAEFGMPQGAVLLTVNGKIARTNGPNGASLDRQMLSQLPQSSVTTLTPWTERKHQYDGVLLSDLLHYLGATGRRLKMTALNDYFTFLELPELKAYSVLLATSVDGRPMRVRDKGPVWLILPLSEFPELDKPQFHEKMIWQLRYLEVLE